MYGFIDYNLLIQSCVALWRYKLAGWKDARTGVYIAHYWSSENIKNSDENEIFDL
jgi:hypothetical protein